MPRVHNLYLCPKCGRMLFKIEKGKIIIRCRGIVSGGSHDIHVDFKLKDTSKEYTLEMKDRRQAQIERTDTTG